MFLSRWNGILFLSTLSRSRRVGFFIDFSFLFIGDGDIRAWAAFDFGIYMTLRHRCRHLHRLLLLRNLLLRRRARLGARTRWNLFFSIPFLLPGFDLVRLLGEIRLFDSKVADEIYSARKIIYSLTWDDKTRHFALRLCLVAANHLTAKSLAFHTYSEFSYSHGCLDRVAALQTDGDGGACVCAEWVRKWKCLSGDESSEIRCFHLVVFGMFNGVFGVCVSRLILLRVVLDFFSLVPSPVTSCGGHGHEGLRHLPLPSIMAACCAAYSFCCIAFLGRCDYPITALSLRTGTAKGAFDWRVKC